MFNIALATYTVRIKDKAQRTNQQVGNFGEGNDLLAVLKGCLEALIKKSAHDPSAKHVLDVLKLEIKDRMISGFIESGVYGRGGNVRHVVRDATTYTTTKYEAMMLPFYFLFDLPEMADEGTLILERAGNMGIRKTLGKAIEGCFSIRHPEFTFQLSHDTGSELHAHCANGTQKNAHPNSK